MASTETPASGELAGAAEIVRAVKPNFPQPNLSAASVKPPPAELIARRLRQARHDEGYAILLGIEMARGSLSLEAAIAAVIKTAPHSLAYSRSHRLAPRRRLRLAVCRSEEISMNKETPMPRDDLERVRIANEARENIRRQAAFNLGRGGVMLSPDQMRKQAVHLVSIGWPPGEPDPRLSLSELEDTAAANVCPLREQQCGIRLAVAAEWARRQAEEDSFMLDEGSDEREQATTLEKTTEDDADEPSAPTAARGEEGQTAGAESADKSEANAHQEPSGAEEPASSADAEPSEAAQSVHCTPSTPRAVASRRAAFRRLPMRRIGCTGGTARATFTAPSIRRAPR
jgi:hypothetical protein